MQVILESLSVLWISPFRDSTATSVWCVFAAVVGAWIYLVVRRVSLGKAVRALEQNGCHTAETAGSAEKLGISPSAISPKEKLIARVEKDGVTHYFLPEESKKKAEYFKKAGGGPLWLNLLLILGAYLVMVITYYLLPDLLEILDAISPF